MPNGENAFEPWIEWFSSTVLETPLRNMPPSKTSFLPSKIDKMKISKYVDSTFFIVEQTHLAAEVQFRIEYLIRN